MIDFVFIVEGRVLRRDELGRPSEQCHDGCANREETAHRDDEAGDDAERDVPRVHALRLGGVPDTQPATIEV